MHAPFLRLPRHAKTVIVACTLATLVVALHWSSHQEAAVALHDMPCYDLDGDGEVTAIDEEIILSYWGQSVPPAPPQANVHPAPPSNPDNDVDIKDLQHLAAHVGQFTDCQDMPIVAKSADNQPDLVVDSIEDTQQPFIDCQTPAGVKVTIRNVGTAWAGPSVTRVSLLGDGGQSLETPMLAPGQTAIVFSTVHVIPFGDRYTALADSTHALAVSDERNTPPAAVHPPGPTHGATARRGGPLRGEPGEIATLRTRAARGGMTPVGAVATCRDTTGPYRVARYTLSPAAALQGSAAPGVSTGDALAKVEELAARILPDGFAFEWTELALQEKQAGNTAIFVFLLATVTVGGQVNQHVLRAAPSNAGDFVRQHRAEMIKVSGPGRIRRRAVEEIELHGSGSVLSGQSDP